MKNMIESTLEVSKNAFDMIIMGKKRVMHIETSLLDNKRDFRTCMSKILKSTGYTSIKSGIRKRFTISGEFRTSVIGGAARLKIGHASTS
jgi:hypothetical protein